MSVKSIAHSVDGRQSQFELLRIICMMFILIHHVITGALPLSNYVLLQNGWEVWLTRILDAFCLVAVNVFVIISGYFTIQSSVKGFLKLYILCAFYAFFTASLGRLLGGGTLGLSILRYTFFPFGLNPKWWFIECYVVLYLISPLLNAGLQNLNQSKIKYLLGIFTIIQVYFGLYRQCNYCDSTGYSVSQFVYMYIIGYYISNYMTKNHSRHIASLSAIVYVFGSIMAGVLDCCNFVSWHSSNPFLDIHCYNHPLIICTSVALFLLFTTFSFQSRVLNYCAASVLPLYLWHSNKWLDVVCYENLANVYNNNTPVLRIILIAIILVVYIIFVVGFDQLRRIISLVIFRFIK